VFLKPYSCNGIPEFVDVLQCDPLEILKPKLPRHCKTVSTFLLILETEMERLRNYKLLANYIPHYIISCMLL